MTTSPAGQWAAGTHLICMFVASSYSCGCWVSKLTASFLHSRHKWIIISLALRLSFNHSKVSIPKHAWYQPQLLEPAIFFFLVKLLLYALRAMFSLLWLCKSATETCKEQQAMTDKQMWPCTNKTLFIKKGSGSDFTHESLFAYLWPQHAASWGRRITSLRSDGAL